MIVRMFRLPLTVFWLFCAGEANAQSGEAAFADDPAEYYGVRFLTTLLVFGATVLLFSLIRYRGELQSPSAWGLLVVGVLIVPSISTMFGTLLVFERAERVEFCGSCHEAMQAYVDDMQDSDSQSLAAVHYRNRYIPRNQCYTCHTSFGLFGTVQAKVAGIVDVHKYYTNTFHRPIEMREPYGNDDCLKCHSGAVRWSTNHGDFREAILSGQVVCLDCHGTDHRAHVLANREDRP